VPIVYLNGAFLPQEQAVVSVMDRGFLFGDGVYEVIPAYGGHPFRIGEHLDRLDSSLSAIRLHNPLPRETWGDVLQQLVARNGGGDQSIYLQVTRGPGPRDHAFPVHPAPTVFAMSNPLVAVPRHMLEQGVGAVTREDIRWTHCHVKAIALLPNVLLRQQAIDEGAYEAILIREGQVTEGAASTVFVVRAGVLHTPPKSAFLLPGITRDLVLDLAAADGIPRREVPIPAQDLPSADEIWLTSSTKEILPVTRLNGRPVSSGRPGPLWSRMHDLYQAYKNRLRHELAGAEATAS
jgi:D-alanine transaminase